MGNNEHTGKDEQRRCVSAESLATCTWTYPGCDRDPSLALRDFRETFEIIFEYRDIV
jgi:hypothetical protein